MRALLSIVVLALLIPAFLPAAAAGTCVGSPGSRVCVGYTVLSTDCRVGAVAVNGIFVEGWAIVGEVFWEVCQGGMTFRGHSIEALSAGWYDMTYMGTRSCAISTYAGAVPTDCAYGPPYLPMLP